MQYRTSFETRHDSASAALLPASFQANITFFSTFDFVAALLRSLGTKYRLLAIPVQGSGPPRTMYAIQTPHPFRSCYVSLALYGLYASPGWDGPLERSTLE